MWSISDSIRFQLTLSKLWWYPDLVIKALSTLEFAFRIFSSNSFKASCRLEFSVISEVKGQGLGTGLFGAIFAVDECVGMSVSSVILEEDATACGTDGISLLLDCFVPSLPNVLQRQIQLMRYILLHAG